MINYWYHHGIQIAKLSLDMCFLGLEISWWSVRVPSLVCKWYDISPALMNMITKVVHFGIVTIWWTPTMFFERIFTLLWEFGIMFLSIQWFLDENHQIKKNSWKKSRFFYMVQVGSQKFTRIFQFLLHILLIAKLGYISLWMIATFTASKNWEKKASKSLT
jgi:hypothetical protein